MAEASSRTLRRRVGLMRQNVLPIPGFTVREQIIYCGWLMGMSTREATVRADDVIAAVNLTEKADDRTSRLSGGQLRRVGLAQVLVGEPEVLLLDEPMAGLDPAQGCVFALSSSMFLMIASSWCQLTRLTTSLTAMTG